MILDKQKISERRKTPRYVADMPADLILDNGTALSVNTRNISSRGLQVVCSSLVTDEIEPRGIQNHMINHIRLKVIINLPISDMNEKLYARCRLMSLLRLSQDKFILNLAFTGFENHSETAMHRFLDQFRQKKVIVKSLA